MSREILEPRERLEKEALLVSLHFPCNFVTLYKYLESMHAMISTRTEVHPSKVSFFLLVSFPNLLWCELYYKMILLSKIFIRVKYYATRTHTHKCMHVSFEWRKFLGTWKRLCIVEHKHVPCLYFQPLNIIMRYWSA